MVRPIYISLMMLLSNFFDFFFYGLPSDLIQNDASFIGSPSG